MIDMPQVIVMHKDRGRLLVRRQDHWRLSVEIFIEYQRG